MNEECDCEDCNHEHAEHTMDEFDEETQKKIQELQILEQNFQQLLIQKQAFKYELEETESALEELAKTDSDIFKIIGGSFMVKTEKAKVLSDLKHKKELIELRTKTIDKQEKEFSKRIEEIRDEVLKKISDKK